MLHLADFTWQMLKIWVTLQIDAYRNCMRNCSHGQVHSKSSTFLFSETGLSETRVLPIPLVNHPFPCKGKAQVGVYLIVPHSAILRRSQECITEGDISPKCNIPEKHPHIVPSYSKYPQLVMVESSILSLLKSPVMSWLKTQ